MGVQATGYVEESTGKNRTIPFELMVQKDKVPVYEETLEDNGRFNEQPVCFDPLAIMARSGMSANEYGCVSVCVCACDCMRVRVCACARASSRNLLPF